MRSRPEAIRTRYDFSKGSNTVSNTASITIPGTTPFGQIRIREYKGRGIVSKPLSKPSPKIGFRSYETGSPPRRRIVSKSYPNPYPNTHSNPYFSFERSPKSASGTPTSETAAPPGEKGIVCKPRSKPHSSPFFFLGKEPKSGFRSSETRASPGGRGIVSKPYPNPSPSPEFFLGKQPKIGFRIANMICNCLFDRIGICIGTCIGTRIGTSIGTRIRTPMQIPTQNVSKPYRALYLNRIDAIAR